MKKLLVLLFAFVMIFGLISCNFNTPDNGEGGENEGENGGENGCGCGDSASAQCKQWMRKLQQLDFALQELTLYLDVYPECGRALEQFRRLRDERESVLREYQEQCGAVYATGNRGDRWEWTDSPWPWQNDFVGNNKGQL